MRLSVALFCLMNDLGNEIYCASDGRSVGRVVAIDAAGGGSEPLIKWLRGLR